MVFSKGSEREKKDFVNHPKGASINIWTDILIFLFYVKISGNPFSPLYALFSVSDVFLDHSSGQDRTGFLN